MTISPERDWHAGLITPAICTKEIPAREGILRTSEKISTRPALHIFLNNAPLPG
jgi:hypothetical protein